MSFTQEQLKAQEDLINDLQRELSHLDSDFTKLLKDANLKPEDLTTIDPVTLSPEVRALYHAAVEKAEREGKARAGQYETTHGAASTTAGTTRKDVIRL